MVKNKEYGENKVNPTPYEDFKIGMKGEKLWYRLSHVLKGQRL